MIKGLKYIPDLANGATVLAIVLSTEFQTLLMDQIMVLLALYFVAEYVIRCALAYRGFGLVGLRKYTFSFWGIVDLISALSLPLRWIVGEWSFWVRVLRVVRLLSALKLLRIGGTDRIFAYALKRAAPGLAITGLITGFTILLSSVAMFLAEGHLQPEELGSIPRSMWWAVATLTTVGYGDIYPVTGVGRVLASILALTSIAIVALPAGIFAACLNEAITKTKSPK